MKRWIQTRSGLCVEPLYLKPEHVCIDDIAHHLSMLCRFTGAVSDFYSVAQHSVHVSEIVPAKYALWGLLHDAAEAYTGDFSRPIKRELYTVRSYALLPIREVEHNILHAIAQGLGLHPLAGDEEKAVKLADDRMLATEVRDLLQPVDPLWAEWLAGIVPLAEPLQPWPHDYAKIRYLLRYYYLRGKTCNR